VKSTVSGDIAFQTFMTCNIFRFMKIPQKLFHLSWQLCVEDLHNIDQYIGYSWQHATIKRKRKVKEKLYIWPTPIVGVHTIFKFNFEYANESDPLVVIYHWLQLTNTTDEEHYFLIYHFDWNCTTSISYFVFCPITYYYFPVYTVLTRPHGTSVIKQHQACIIHYARMRNLTVSIYWLDKFPNASITLGRKLVHFKCYVG